MSSSWCFILMVLLTTGAYAQTGKPATGSLSGKIVDNKNNPLGYATVTLLRTDSSVVNGDMSKEDGNFSIAPTGAGNFLLRIESIGYAKKIMSVQIGDKEDKNVGKIKLSVGENTLKEVSITGEKAVMELKVDKKVFNVDKNTTTAGGSATDVLQNVPAVSVGADGTVSLRGKSDVTILIDGKPATLLGSDVTSALQSLPAGSIESVEVITNPSAKYDAQGTTGIINIVTKKDGRMGMNGNVTLGAGTNEKYNGNLGLNLRKGKWNTFLNSSFRLNSTYNNISTERKDKDSAALDYFTGEHSPRNFDGFFNTIGVTYDPDKYNSITITENINKMMFGYRDYSDYYVDSGDTRLMYQNRYTDFAAHIFSLSSAIDYKRKFKKKDEELSVDGTFAHNDFRRKQFFRTVDSPAYSGGNPTISDAPANGWNNSLNVWADYTDPLFTKNGKLGLGFKSQIFWFNSHCDQPIVTYGNGTKEIDSSLLTNFEYSQQTHAAYVNWSDQVGKLSYQAGLRFEDAIYDGKAKVPTDTTFHNEFANFFPSAFVAYQLNNQQSVYINYSKRVNRPGFMQLMPFKDYSNTGTVSMGNSGLIPEFTDNIELSYNRNDSKGNNFIVSGYYAHTKNITQRVTRPITGSQDDIDLGLQNEVGKLLNRPMNISAGTTYGLEGTGRFQLTKFWDATLNINFFQNELTIGNGVDTVYRRYVSDTKGSSYFAKVNSNIKLPKNFSLQFNANYESPKVVAQGKLQESYWMDIAIKKTLFNNKATIVLNCSDVFNTRVFINRYDLAAYSSTVNREKETRILNLNFTYRFGKTDMGKGNAKGGRPDKSMEKKTRIEKPSGEDREKNLKDSGDDDQGGGGGGQGGGQKREGRGS